MLETYFDYIMPMVQYEKDEEGRIFAYIENYPEYITEGDNFEDARENMMEVIEDIVMYKFQTGDQQFINTFKKISTQHSYA